MTLDWLATGRLPKTRAELRAALQTPRPAAPKINVDALEAIIEGALRLGRNVPPAKLAAHCASLYVKCIDDGLITTDGIGDGNLDAAA